MTAPTNNDAALVRGLEKLRRYGGNAVLGEDEANAIIDSYDRLAATAERADEMQATAENAVSDAQARQRDLEEELAGAEAALLAAQQERDEARDENKRREQITRDEMKRADEYQEAYRRAEDDFERAEATITRLRDALERICGPRTHDRNSDGSIVTAQQIARAALAQDAEQA